MADPVDVDAAGGNVGGDERVDVSLVEPGEGLLALRLGLVAVHRDGVDALGTEPLDQAVRASLRANEDQGEAALVAQLRDQGVELALMRDADESVLDPRGRALRHV